MQERNGCSVGKSPEQRCRRHCPTRCVISSHVSSPARSSWSRSARAAFCAIVVEQTLAGHADRLKGYTIATAVFERDASFDAQADPVVRTEAGRLRRALERYYLVAGQADPVLIEVPKGGYVPIFTRRAALRAEVAGC